MLEADLGRQDSTIGMESQVNDCILICVLEDNEFFAIYLEA